MKNDKNLQKKIKKGKKTKETNKLTGKKLLMFNELIKNKGNITESVAKVGIDRTTHYLWLKADILYKTYIDSIDDYIVDFYENALNSVILEKNITAIIFALKCKGKHRGWIEKQQIDISGGLSNSLDVTGLAEVWNKIKKEESDE